MPRYAWPEIEGLVAFTRKHGVLEASRKLGVPVTTLRSHFNKHRIHRDEYSPPKTLNDDALREIHDLIA